MSRAEFLEFLEARGVSPRGAETAWELLGEEGQSLTVEELDAAVRELVETVRLDRGL